jgi:predicted Rossmann-fold nucleotide-binding protein
MGVVADAALDAGEVIGVIPQHLVDRGVAHLGLTRLEVDGRTSVGADGELGDAFVALRAPPDARGLFEVWTWGQLGLHGSPAPFSTSAGLRPLIEQLGVMAAGLSRAGPARPLGVVNDADSSCASWTPTGTLRASSC